MYGRTYAWTDVYRCLSKKIDWDKQTKAYSEYIQVRPTDEFFIIALVGEVISYKN